MNEKFNNQEIGNNLCPILNKREAAAALGVSVSILSKMESAGIILYDYMPGMKAPIYFRATLNRIDEIHRDWKLRNPALYEELQK